MRGSAAYNPGPFPYSLRGLPGRREPAWPALPSKIAWKS